MKTTALSSAAGLLLSLSLSATAATLYVDVNNLAAAAPYTNWVTAATNIQDAVDVSVDGDLILVTNGVYAGGGRVMAGDLTNRVALNKALTVQSVNGPFATVIQGAGATNGNSAVRCAWLTNGASLVGFTLQAGATRNTTDPALGSGGGAWCASSNAIVANCLVVSNTAFYYGGGAYQGTLNNCLVSSNGLTTGNYGAAHNSMLNSCTVVSNSSYGVSYLGPYPATLTDCIVYYNTRGNYSGCIFSYCCTTPLPSGTGNFTNAPQLFMDGHLSSTSPCRGAGTNLVTGTDIFGQPWLNPPSVGCAEWQSVPMAGPPRLRLTSDPVGFTVNVSSFAGQPPFTNYWIKDGIPLQDDGHFSSTQTTNLVATGVSFADAGAYQLVVTNAYGTVTSSVARLVVHCVDAAGTNPVTPYSSWATAATNIQGAISSSLAGEVVLVTNGIYATGGTSMDGVITNRISVNKTIIVQSVNGPAATLIQGAWDPAAKNGPGAVRCAWLTNNATLSGFTLFRGASRALGFPITPAMVGGGVWASSTSATVFNCLIATNTASAQGGGAYQVSLNNCTLLGNQCPGTGDGGGSSSGDGGGAYRCNLKNCIVSQNFANNDGGGTANCYVRNSIFTQNQVAYSLGSADYYGVLVNCTLFNNTYTSKTERYGGAAAYSHLTNCIVYGNHVVALGAANYTSCTMSYCDSDPLPAGTGNIDADPQLLADGVHIAATSPCRGAGVNVASGTDIDGQTWANPPAIGCDEWQPAPLVGGQPQTQLGGIPLSATFGGLAVIGQAPYSYWWSKDGVLLEDGALFSSTHSTNLIANNFGPADAGGYQLIVSNSFGMATSAVAQVTVHVVDAAGSTPATPFSSWATAATNIQDAIDTAVAGDFILVTNGLYATGGRAMAGTLTNRVALTKSVVVASVNGPSATIIQGAWDPATTNGPLAVRCAWLTNGATLNGFTLRNGATQPYTGLVGSPLVSGGGVWCSSTNGIVSNCVLTNNAASFGGGISFGTLNNSLVVLNLANYGGGAYYATLNNCTVILNCTTTLSPYHGAGTYDGITRNSIVLYNYDYYPYGFTEDDYFASGGAKYYYCCTSINTLIVGTGNFSASPLFLDLFHIPSNSPCNGSGSPLYSTGTDLDGEPWNNPPSIGCDEVVLANLVGPLRVALTAPQTNLLVNHYGNFSGSITGRASRVQWVFGDSTVITNSGSGATHQWTNTGDFFVTFTAFNTDNPGGVSTNLLVHILPVNPPQLQSALMTSNAFEFQFTGQASANYYIQIATNLAAPVYWQTLQTIYYSTGGIYQILDFRAVTNTAGFYRVLAH
ncbi:MAG: PKD domain-containing protein [Verrucomicrobiota bacterium]